MAKMFSCRRLMVGSYLTFGEELSEELVAQRLSCQRIPLRPPKGTILSIF